MLEACLVGVVVECKAGMLVVAGTFLGQIILVEVVENLSLYSKELKLGQDMLRYSNPDRIMAQSG